MEAGGIFGLEAGGLLWMCLPILTPPYVPLYMIPGIGKVLPEEEGDIYIHLGRRKVRRSECGRQTGSGGLGVWG